MASLIPGYEYDIFISYRQKDNKGDRWVSEFVETLKTELESTFKEEINIYFDINPNDGLLETHDVDASLKDKLKCLVFIPIISRTYCDPKSFAWEHEFRAFVEQASHDQFGLKIKLPNGNVASRVLPIQIHDLKPEDKVLVEKELGGFLRAVEFIYREPGVNRPLKSDDDDRINLNKTKYRNQINKTANAIDEIINSLESSQSPFLNEKPQADKKITPARKEGRTDTEDKSVKLSRRKLLSGVAILAVLIVSAILVYPKLFKQDTLEKLRSSGERISVAVMPFQNMTNDTTWNIWQDGIQANLITSLSNYSEDLIIRQAESVNSLIQSKGLTNYASITSSVASSISQKLDANIFIYGSINKADATIRLNAQFINSKTKEIIKSVQIDGTAEKILNMIDSLSVIAKDFLIISALKKEVSLQMQPLASTDSPGAYRYFIYGNDAFFTKGDFSTAIKLYSQAVAIDSNFVWATLMISFAYMHQGLYEESRKWAFKAYEKRDQLPMIQKIWTNYVYSSFNETPHDALKYSKQLLEIDNQSPIAYFEVGACYKDLHQYDKAIPEFENALELYKKWNSKPIWVSNYAELGGAYHRTGQCRKEKKLYKKAEKDFPNNVELIYKQAVLALSEGEEGASNQYIEKFISLSKDNSTSEEDITTNLAMIYEEANILDKAEAYYRTALSAESENPVRISNLANFLIDKDRNIKEGLELADKALGINPDDYAALHSKGWGLYKQGQYQEALEILQKSSDIRRETAVYNYTAFLHLEAAKKAVASQKNN